MADGVSQLNPSISLGVQAPQGGNLLTGNPLDTVGKFATIQNQMNQNRLFQQTFAARQKAGQILASAPDLETGITQLQQDPDTAAFAGEIANSSRQAAQTLLSMQGEQQTQATNGMKTVMNGLGAGLADYRQLQPTIDANMKLLSPSAQARVGPAINGIITSLTSGLPDDPKAAQDLYHKRLIGLLSSSDVTPERLNSISGAPTTQDIGGAIQPGLTAPGQAFQPQGAPISKTLAPQVIQGPFGPGGATTAQQIGGGSSGSNPLAAPGSGPSGMPQIGEGGRINPLTMSGPQMDKSLGLSGPSQAQGAFNTKAGDDMAAYKSDLDTTTHLLGTSLATVGAARDTLQDFKAGGGASAYAKVAQLAQAFGANNDTVDKISQGSLPAAQEFEKLMVNTTMGQAESQLPKGSRFTQGEFQEFKKNNPNIDTDPRAIDKIFNFWGKMYNMNHAEQTGMNQYLAGGGDITQWPAKWQDQAQASGFFNSQPGQGSSVAPSGAGPAVTHKYIPGQGIVPIGRGQ